MYMILFLVSLLALVTLSVLYMLVAYNIETIKRCCCFRKPNCPQCRQDNDVWNISGRLNHQGLDRWPTHDHHVSIDSFAFPPEYQAKDSRSAPPPYTEVDLPTYEEAISACANHKTTTLPVPVHAAVDQSRSNAEV